MSVPALALAKPSESLPQCDPHLMPFRISYSGPAPIKSYFMIKPASSSVGQEPDDVAGKVAKAETQSAVEKDSFAHLGGECMDVDQMDLTGDIQEPSAPEPLSNAPSSSSSLTLCDKGEQKRSVAAFRGRTVHGLQVTLPDGYTGIVLRPPDASGKAKERKGVAPKATPTSRTTRRGHSAAREHGHESEETDEGASYFAQLNARTLTPTHVFPSFTLWHPDIPVDEARDEYWRSLQEWVTLSHEIHACD
ncbi:hypothetical protein GLOTRDRAFT_137996 [Gloeophyllum trabeum ATCC 11539]|uniref:Uncharacterized protein n=1 Tax=Gloeophyllum trabeum (strain ATCC 11539 / FP-39264 / Madison 617) TaxID=670483 RepID=S7Q9J7_GLOTA|nr:uncharacterized protein GLOTRDRAFT_137996 [Gloeophyllum trabeum ATCC 11539]EPQ56192.1 hypothetical protein GLOTRDRAFT_137996 [Gloeophyllum trabeum ATCC 11539]